MTLGGKQFHHDWLRIAWSGKEFVAVGDGGTILTSP